MRKLHAHGFDTADSIIIGLACVNLELDRSARILDYGCGTGSLVYRFRELGFDAYGFDIHNVVNYDHPSDERFFRFLPNPPADTSNMEIDWKAFRVPFDDNSFDLVVSTSVLEHVLNLGPVMAEIGRVLRPESYALHLYPGIDVVIEPHMYVPFASRLQSWWWFYFWALLGVRNEYQRHLTAAQTADRNMLYCQTGLRYRNNSEVRAICSPYFETVNFVDESFHATASRARQLAAFKRAVFSQAIFRNLAPLPKSRVLLTGGKRAVSRSAERVVGNAGIAA
jgi:SAM-dependent methyltransferase